MPKTDVDGVLTPVSLTVEEFQNIRAIQGDFSDLDAVFTSFRDAEIALLDDAMNLTDETPLSAEGVAVYKRAIADLVELAWAYRYSAEEQENKRVSIFNTVYDFLYRGKDVIVFSPYPRR